MTTIWVCIVLAGVLSFVLKAVGPAVLGSRELPPRARAVVAVLAPALLAGLVLTNVLGAGWDAFDAVVVAGVAAAVVVRLLKAPMLVAVAAAVLVAALLRLWF